MIRFIILDESPPLTFWGKVCPTYAETTIANLSAQKGHYLTPEQEVMRRLAGSRLRFARSYRDRLSRQIEAERSVRAYMADLEPTPKPEKMMTSAVAIIAAGA